MKRLSTIEIPSSKPIMLVQLSNEHVELLAELGRFAADNPSYNELGRASIRKNWSEIAMQRGSLLHDFGAIVCEEYLGANPTNQSNTLVNVLTNAGLYNEEVSKSRVATHWHHDFVYNPNSGLFEFAPPNQLRVVVTSKEGTQFIDSPCTIHQAEMIEASDRFEKTDVSDLEGNIVAPDYVAIKVENTPNESNIHELRPNTVCILPRDTLHRAHPNPTDGRIFWQMDLIGVDLTDTISAHHDSHPQAA